MSSLQNEAFLRKTPSSSFTVIDLPFKSTSSRVQPLARGLSVMLLPAWQCIPPNIRNFGTINDSYYKGTHKCSSKKNVRILSIMNIKEIREIAKSVK